MLNISYLILHATWLFGPRPGPSYELDLKFGPRNRLSKESKKKSIPDFLGRVLRGTVNSVTRWSSAWASLCFFPTWLPTRSDVRTNIKDKQRLSKGFSTKHIKHFEIIFFFPLIWYCCFYFSWAPLNVEFKKKKNWYNVRESTHFLC